MNEALVAIVAISVLGPVIGSLIGVIRKPGEMFMYNMLAFAGGVMIAISFLELIPESIALSSIGITVSGIIIGAIFMFILDKSINHIHPELLEQEQGKNLKKTATYLIVGIFFHNIPEGMAMAIGAVSEIKISIVIALAIAIHNIPEGICTSAPYFHTTHKRLKSFLVSSSTAVPLLIGFVIAYYIFTQIPTTLIGFVIGATAGLMIYIVADEMIPSSCCKVSNHTTIFSLILGILFVILLGLI